MGKMADIAPIAVAWMNIWGVCVGERYFLVGGYLLQC